MCKYGGKRPWKKSFLSILVWELASKDSTELFRGQKCFVFKVPIAGTLNVCYKMPDTEQKTRIQSDHTGLRKRQKTDEKY